MGLVSGIIGVVFKLNDMKVNDIAKSFDKGAAELLGAALCVGMAQGIIIILGGTSATEGTVLNTILHSIGEGMKNFPPMLSAWLMYVFQTIFNFQLGDAFSNFIVPTSGCLLGALAAARLDWGKWAKFQIKFQAVLFVFASAAMVIAVMTGFN